MYDPIAPNPTTPDVTSNRRDMLKKGAAFTAGIATPAIANAYSVPDLQYDFDALEPYIDAPTMKIHHDKHHGTYVANINKATEGKDEVPILDLMADALEATPVRNSGGGHYNHAFFWDVSFFLLGEWLRHSVICFDSFWNVFLRISLIRCYLLLSLPTS